MNETYVVRASSSESPHGRDLSAGPWHRAAIVAGVSALVLVGVSLWTTPAAACSCTRRAPAEYVAAADQVFIGRAQAPRVKGDKRVQAYDVLLKVKGKLGRTVAITRGAGVTSCDVVHKRGEIAVLFVRNGALSLCDGNYALSYQLAYRFEEYLEHDNAKVASAKLGAFRLALGATLKPYLHSRQRLLVKYAPLDGQSFKLAGTSIRFIKTAPKGGPLITVGAAVRNKGVTFFDLSYRREGLKIKVLVGPSRKGGKLKVWGTSAVER